MLNSRQLYARQLGYLGQLGGARKFFVYDTIRSSRAGLLLGSILKKKTLNIRQFVFVFFSLTAFHSECPMSECPIS